MSASVDAADFREAAAHLGPTTVQRSAERLMTQITLTVEANVKKRSRVKTGRLRRSWTSRVEAAGERGIVGTNVSYAKTQRNQPLAEGLDDSRPAIAQLLADAGATITTIS